MKNIKKFWALFLVFAMVLSIVPMATFAEGTPQAVLQVQEEGGIKYYDATGGTANADNFVVSTSKTIKETGVENEFEITLGVQTTVDVQELAVDPDAAVVLVIDTSDSMKDGRLAKAKAAAKEFIDSYVKDATGARMLSIVTFYGIGTKDNYKGHSKVELGWTDLTEAGVDGAKGIIDGLTTSLGTFTQGGLMLARNLYLPDNAPTVGEGEDEKVIDNRFVVMLTDGNPTHMLGTREKDRWNNTTGYTTSTSDTSITSITGNLLTGTSSDANVPPARAAAAEIAKQIKNGDNDLGNYTAQIYTIGFNIEEGGFANSFNGSGKHTGDEWLKNNVASGQAMHYVVGDTDNLNLAFEKISELIKRFTNAWIVTDPMAEFIVYDDASSLGDNNSASFDPEKNTLSWNIKTSNPVNVVEMPRGDVETTVYTYELTYKVTLDNLGAYEAMKVIPTNETTTLYYVVADKELELLGDEAFVTADFTIPEILGFDADLTFDKVDGNDDALAGAKFALYYGESEKAIATAVSDNNGKVSFTDIPSGHAYTLKETATPDAEKFAENDTVYDVVVSYGDLTIGDESADDFKVINYPIVPIETKLIIEKVWKDKNGDVFDPVDVEATFQVIDKDGNIRFENVLPGEYDVLPGEYTIVENALNGYELEMVEGADSYDIDLMQATVNVSADETVKVTFYNQIVDYLHMGNIHIDKLVVDGDAKVRIVEWLMSKESELDYDIYEVRDDIKFKIHNSNSNGEDLGVITGVEGKIDDGSVIVFLGPDGEYQFNAGWYLVVEELGPIAKEVFQDPISNLLIYFNGVTVAAKTGQGGTVIDPDAVFTITQYKKDTRPLQAIYVNSEGKKYYLRNAPALDYPDRPNNGGGALGTSRFTATSGEDVYTSFCADIGAIAVKGNYYVDETNHGLDDKTVERLVAAVDFIYNKYGFEEYDGVALAQIVIWNVVLKYSTDEMVADHWLKKLDPAQLYTEAHGDLTKIEGYNNSNGKNYWYTQDYKDTIDNILEHMEDDHYVEIHKTRISQSGTTYVSGAVFLKGDGSASAFMQQRQVIILFDDPAVVENIPHEVVDPFGNITLKKSVVQDGQVVAISTWILENVAPEKQQDIIDDIKFVIYNSDSDGNKIGEALNAIGVLDFDLGAVNFYVPDAEGEPTSEPYNFNTGWYFVEENMGDLAKEIFKEDATLLIYFDATTGKVIGNTIEVTPIPRDTKFTIKQFKGETRALQAVYQNSDGKKQYLRNTPALNVENRPNNGGGALGTSRFTASTIETEPVVYTSFCGDLGAIAVKGTYVIDQTRFGFSDEAVEELVAAIDYIWARSNFENYEDYALAQIVVWNMVLRHSDSKMSSDLWLRDIKTALTYNEAWGDLIKIEGYNNSNGKNYWYTPEYKALVDDILNNPAKYVEIYKENVRTASRPAFVGGVEFLIGDGQYEKYYQQRQILIQFGDEPDIKNEPVETVYHEVTFLDINEDPIGEVQLVADGESATAPEPPEVDGYEFVEWDTEFEIVTEDLTVKAVYTEVFEVTFVFRNSDGQDVSETQKVVKGEAAVPPTLPELTGVNFTGWDIEEYKEVTQNLTVTAQYEAVVPNFKVTFVDHDGTVLKEQVVAQGEEVTPPADPTREGYTFTGWDTEEYLNVTKDLTVTAQYEEDEPEPETFTVTFLDHDETELKVQVVEKGQSATPPEDPTREGYTFTGWDTDEYEEVTRDLTVIAQYKQNDTEPETYIVSIFDYDMETDETTFLEDITVSDGASFTLTLADESAAYQFTVDGEDAYLFAGGDEYDSGSYKFVYAWDGLEATVTFNVL